MKLPAVVEVDLRESRRGLTSRLGDDLRGRPVLAATVEGLLECARLAPPVVMVHRRDADAARALLAGTAVADAVTWQVHDHDDISARPWLRRARRWGKEGWRGGLLETFFASEAANPAALAETYDTHGWQCAMLVPAEAALLDPRVVDEIAAAFLAEPSRALLLSTAPPGIGGDVLTRGIVQRMHEGACGLEHLLPFAPDAPDADPDALGIFHHFEEGITGNRGRYTIDSGHSFALANELWGTVAAQHDRDCRALFAAEAEHPDAVAGAGPEELVLAAGIAGSAWSAVCESFALRDDALVTFTGARSDSLGDPELEKRIRAARDAGAFGIHVETMGEDLDTERAGRLIAAEPDVISVDFGALEQSRAAAVEMLLEARGEMGSPLIVAAVTFDRRTAPHIEGFFDAWFGRVDAVSMRGPLTETGAEPPESLGAFAPPSRFPCGRLLAQMPVLADGRVPLCVSDPHCATSLGDLREQSVAEVWQGAVLRRQRDLQRRAALEETDHCGPCVSWFRWD